MNAGKFNLATLRPWAEIWLWRYGLLPPLFIALILAVLFVWLVVVPAHERELDSLTARLQQIEQNERSAREAIETARQQSPIQAFRTVLADPAASNEVVRQIFEIATEAGINVAQADYRRTNDTYHNWTQLQIALPVKGRYVSLREFTLKLLHRMPAVSVDQIILRREAPGAYEIDGQMVLSVWQRSKGGGQDAREGARQ